MLIKAEIFMKCHKSTMKNFYKIILRKLTKDAKRKIDKESKQFAKHFRTDDRIECSSDQHAFVTLKHHKDNFKNNSSADS